MSPETELSRRLRSVPVDGLDADAVKTRGAVSTILDAFTQP